MTDTKMVDVRDIPGAEDFRTALEALMSAQANYIAARETVGMKDSTWALRDAREVAIIDLRNMISSLLDAYAERSEAPDIEALEMEDHEAQARRIVGARVPSGEPTPLTSLAGVETLLMRLALTTFNSTGSVEAFVRQDASYQTLLETFKAGLADSERLDWLEGESERERGFLRSHGTTDRPDSLFRRNQPITRAAIDSTMQLRRQPSGDL